MAREQKKPSRAGFSRAEIWFGVTVQALCVVFLVIAANYVGFHYYQRWDLSRSQQFSLAEQTKQALRQFEQPMKAVVYFSTSSLGMESAIAGDVKNLLDELAFSARGKLDVNWVDPARDPARAREAQAKYGFDGNENVLILDYAGRTKFIPILDLGDFDVSGLPVGEPARLQAFKGEAVLTGAFIELLNPVRARIYFVQGHGEVTAAKLTQFTDALTRQNTEVLGLKLAAVESIPKDAGAVCIFGAQYDLADGELAMLERYWQQNGRIVVLIDPDPLIRMPNLRKLVSSSCIYPRNDRVLRLLQNPFDTATVGIYRDVIGTFLPDSPITKRLGGVNASFVGGTLSLALDLPVAARAGIELRPLVQAAEAYWGETLYQDAAKTGVRYDDGQDTGQPVIVAALAEKGGARDERTDLATSRMVVVGNSAFIEDAALTNAATQGNLDFMVSVINRMIDGRSKLTGVAPRPVLNYMLNLTEAQLRAIALYTLLIIPAAAALLGIIVGLRRRA